MTAHPHRVRRSVSTALTVAILLASCSDDSSDSADSAASSTSSTAVVDVGTRDDVVTALTDEVVVPAYVAADDRAAELEAAVSVLCAAPTDAPALEQARTAWRATRAAWAYTRAARFGPVMEQRAMSQVDFPVDPEKLAALIAGSDPLDAESVGGLGADQRGLGAIELALFIDDTIDARECEFAASASTLVHTATTAVATAWVDDPPTDSKTFIDGVVNGVIFALVDVGDQQLGKASGDVSGEPEFAEVDDGPARSTLDEIASVLDGVSALIDGGLADLVATVSPDAAARVRTELDAAIAAVAAVPPPMATTTDTAPLSAAYEAVLVPLRTMRTEFASLLGVTLTLGDADGDS